MKKFIMLVILPLVAVYGVGRFNLGESGAMRFVTKMESLINEGKSEEVCAMFHDDIEVDVENHSGEATETVSGGKKELCDLTAETVAALKLVPHTMNVEFTDITATQTMSKPWTGQVSYSEHRTFGIPAANISLRTVSEDEITLVQTFSGVKMRKLKSAIYKAEAS